MRKIAAADTDGNGGLQIMSLGGGVPARSSRGGATIELVNLRLFPCSALPFSFLLKKAASTRPAGRPPSLVTRVSRMRTASETGPAAGNALDFAQLVSPAATPQACEQRLMATVWQGRFLPRACDVGFQ